MLLKSPVDAVPSQAYEMPVLAQSFYNVIFFLNFVDILFVQKIK